MSVFVSSPAGAGKPGACGRFEIETLLISCFRWRETMQLFCCADLILVLIIT